MPSGVANLYPHRHRPSGGPVFLSVSSPPASTSHPSSVSCDGNALSCCCCLEIVLAKLHALDTPPVGMSPSTCTLAVSLVRTLSAAVAGDDAQVDGQPLLRGDVVLLLEELRPSRLG